MEITIENRDHSLLPGMFAKVELISDTHFDVPVVPKEVIMKRQGRDLAFAVREEVKGKKAEAEESDGGEAPKSPDQEKEAEEAKDEPTGDKEAEDETAGDVEQAEGEAAAEKRYRTYMVELKLGYYDLNQYEVIEGLAPGDLVVDKNIVILKDRTEVSIINPPGEEAQPSPENQ